LRRPHVQYLCFAAILYPDNRLEPRPGYLTGNPHGAKEPSDGGVLVELADVDGKTLLQQRLAARAFCGDGQAVAAASVVGKLPFNAETRVIRFFRKDLLIHEIHVSAEKPRVTLAWRPSRKLDGRHTVTWKGDHPDGLPLHYFLRYTHTDGGRWRPVSLMTDATKEEIDLDRLPGGSRCGVGVVATDGINTVMAESARFSVPVKGCVTTILAPEDKAVFEAGEAVWLRGQGFYLEENRAAETDELAWTSSRDGVIGTGPVVRTRLSPGSHRITLNAGKGKSAGEASMSLRIAKPATH
jgi:hypothetical protein